MRLFSIITSLLILLPGCGITSAPIVLSEPAEFYTFQRSTIPLPGSKGKINLTIDDITRGQVITNLAWVDGTPIVTARSLRQNDVVTFTANDHTYKIRLRMLANVLLGDDSAIFQLWPANIEIDNFLSETDKIDALFLSLSQIVGATFIRDEKELTLNEAIVYLKTKWYCMISEIRTVDDFIRIVGSKSSTSGKPYVLKMSDGTEIETEKWFRDQLELMNAIPNKRIDHDKQ